MPTRKCKIYSELDADDFDFFLLDFPRFCFLGFSPSSDVELESDFSVSSIISFSRRREELFFDFDDFDLRLFFLCRSSSESGDSSYFDLDFFDDFCGFRSLELID